MLPLDPFLYDFLDGVEWWDNIEINLFWFFQEFQYLWFGSLDVLIFWLENFPIVNPLPKNDPRWSKVGKGPKGRSLRWCVWGTWDLGTAQLVEEEIWTFHEKSSKKIEWSCVFFQLVPHIFLGCSFWNDSMINLRRFLIAKMCKIHLDWGIHSMRRIFEERFLKKTSQMQDYYSPSCLQTFLRFPSTFSNPTFSKDSSSHHFSGFNSHVVPPPPLAPDQILGPGSARWHFSDSLVRLKKKRNVWEDGDGRGGKIWPISRSQWRESKKLLILS